MRSGVALDAVGRSFSARENSPPGGLVILNDKGSFDFVRRRLTALRMTEWCEFGVNVWGATIPTYLGTRPLPQKQVVSQHGRENMFKSIQERVDDEPLLRCDRIAKTAHHIRSRSRRRPDQDTCECKHTHIVCQKYKYTASEIGKKAGQNRLKQSGQPRLELSLRIDV